MADPILISGPTGAFADVAADAGGWVVAYRLLGGPVVLLWTDEAGDAVGGSLLHIPTGSVEDSTFTRLIEWQSRTFVAYRAVRDGTWQAVVRECTDGILSAEQTLGFCGGNSPVCLSGDGWVAWQDYADMVVRGMRLDTGERVVLRAEVRPTGIARIDAGRVVFIDEARLEVAGMWNPVTAGDCTVGEGESGIAVVLPEKRGQLLSGICMTPRVAVGHGVYAAVTWGGPGVRLVLFTAGDIEAPAVDVSIGGPKWVGFFMFADGTAPGNCALLVRNVSGRQQARPFIATAETVRLVTGQCIGYWCDAPPTGGTVGDVERMAYDVAARGYRPVAYWDARHWPRKPLLPPRSWICVQAYCGVDEPVADFETSIGQAVRTAAGYGYAGVAVVAQCYTRVVPGDDHTKDLASLVPVFARVAKDPRVVAVLAFSGAGRAGGLEDHPEVRPLWERLAASVTQPRIDAGEGDDMKPPQIEGTTFDPVIAAGKPWRATFRNEGDGTVFTVRKDASDRLWIEADNALGHAATGAVRQLRVEGPAQVPSQPPAPTEPAEPVPVPPAPQTPAGVTLATFWGTSLQVGSGGLLRAIGSLLTPTAFTVRRAPDGRLGLRAGSLWVAAEQDGRLMCNRLKDDDYVPEGWQAFTVVDRGDGQVSLLTAHDRFVAVEPDGRVNANRLAAGDYERLTPSGPLGVAREQVSGRISVASGRFRNDGGFVGLRFISEFSAAHLCRTGDEGEVVRRFDRAAHARRNGVRLLCMASNLFSLSPQMPGYWTALSKAATLAAERGLYVEPCAFADAQVVMASRDDRRAFVSDYAQWCREHANVVPQLANEPQQNGWAGALDPDLLDLAERFAPAYGSRDFSVGDPPDIVDVEGGEPLLSSLRSLRHRSNILVLHGSRQEDPARFARWVDHLKGFHDFRSQVPSAALWHDEPMGMASVRDVPLPGGRTYRREARADALVAATCVSAVLQIGFTTHYISEQDDTVPGLDASGIAADIPQSPDWVFINAALSGSPVVSFSGFEKVRPSTNGTEAWAVAYGHSKGTVEWAAGFVPEKVYDGANVEVWRARR